MTAVAAPSLDMAWRHILVRLRGVYLDAAQLLTADPVRAAMLREAAADLLTLALEAQPPSCRPDDFPPYDHVYPS